MSQDSTSPLLSVIIPTYNRSAWLDLTLRSLVDQSLDRSAFEVIIVDDGSSDDSEAIAQAYTGKLNLRYIYQQRNGYQLALARNTGIRAATGEICLFIDSGILLGSTCLEAHVVTHRSSDRPLALIGYVYGLDVGGQITDGLEAAIQAYGVDDCIRRFKAQATYLDPRESFYRRYNDRIDLLPAPWVSFFGCHISAARSVLVAVGMFDEQFRSHNVEDVELAYRLHVHGARFMLARNAESLHYPHERSTAEHARSTAENVRYMHAKHQSPVTELCLTNPWWELNDSILAKLYVRGSWRDLD